MSKKEKRRYRRLCAEVLAENGRRCAICDRAPATTIDHILPRAHGGTNERRNLRGACPDCNQEKGCRVPDNAPAPGKAALAERRRARARRSRYTPAQTAEPGSPWNGEWLTPLGERLRPPRGRRE